MMRASVSVLLVVVAMTLVAAACSSTGPTARVAESARACDADWAEAFDAWGEAGFSGTIAIRERGELSCSVAYGVADADTGRTITPDTVFSIGSITKALTAAAILGLVDDGQFELTDTVGSVLSDLEWPAAGLLIADLLVHTSGLQGRHGEDHEALDRTAAVARLGGLDIAFEPGEGFLYSNAGYSLLALIVDEVTGSYRDVISNRVAVGAGFWDGEPAPATPRALGYLDDRSMGETGDFVGPHWALDGNGGVAMTAERLALWFDDLARGELLSQAGLDRMTTVEWDNGDGSGETPGLVAFTEAIFGERGFSASGGGGSIGHDMVAVWLPETERVIVVASNTGDIRAEELLQAVLAPIIAGDPLQRPAPLQQLDAVATRAAVGTYVLGDGSFVVTEAQGALVVAATGATPIATLFAPIEVVGAAAYRAHEDAVRAFANGETKAGQEERELVEQELGPIESVEILGTIFGDGELRTYLSLGPESGDFVQGWVALDGRGELAAAELGAASPSLELVPSDGSWIPRSVGAPVPPIVVTFDGSTMTIEGPESIEIALAE